MKKRIFWPILKMDGCVDSFRSAEILPTLYASCSHWKEDMVPADGNQCYSNDITVFTSYRFSCMSFVLDNGHRTLQHAMDVILLPVIWKCTSVCLDNVITYDKQYMNTSCMFTPLLHRAGAMLNFMMCKLDKEKVDYLENLIRPGRLKLGYHMRDEIGDLRPPPTLTEMKSFLGLCNLYPRLATSFV